MDQLSSTLAESFRISSIPNDTACPHPRLSEYKMKPSNIPDQETRRKRILEDQKAAASDKINHARSLVEVDEWEMEVEVMEVQLMFNMVSHLIEKVRKKRNNPFKNQLMMSEWLVDLPPKFSDDWIMVISPIGKRCLIVASRGRTTCYTKSGYNLKRFQSLLPGGGCDSVKSSDYTVLDCIYSELTRTFYILDLMCWKGHPVYDSETEFRFYWITAKLEECLGIAEESSHNQFKFVAAETFPCDNSSIFDALTIERKHEIDGVLFYHKQAHYHPGNTPLVGWLKVYMIPEIIGADVPSRFYKTFREFISSRWLKRTRNFARKRIEDSKV